MRKLMLVGLMVAGAGAAFGQVVNGGFETGDMTGWTVVNTGGFSGVTGAAGPGTNNSGNWHYRMGATAVTSQTDFYQDIATVAGTSYLVSYFAYDMDPASVANMTVTFGGAQIGLNRPAAAYTEYTGSFLAVSSSTRLEVTGWEVNQYINVDDFTVRAVPEPASMAALGLGVVALIRRRRTAK